MPTNENFFQDYDPIRQVEAMEYAELKARPQEDARLRNAFFRAAFVGYETPSGEPDPPQEPTIQTPPFLLETEELTLTAPLPSDTETLVLCVGLPRSGKSTWARAQGYPIVSPDNLRLALHGQAFIATAEPIVWAAARLMVASLFLSGHKVVILDACNVSRKRRAEWLDKRWRCVYAVKATGADECVRRAKETGREEIIPVIRRMASEFEPVTMPVNETPQPPQ
jgi:predicted kinase